MGKKLKHRLKEQAWAAGKTQCHWCCGEMYFRGLEAKEAAKARLGLSTKRELRAATATLEHLVPLSQGGPTTRRNLRLAHASCNSKRGAPEMSLTARAAILGRSCA